MSRTPRPWSPLAGLVVLAIFLSAPPAASGDELKLLDQAAVKMFQTLATVNERLVVAVDEFQVPGEGRVRLGRMLAGMLEEKFKRSGKFVVVVRRELDRVIAEGKRTLEDLFESKSKVRLGGLKVASAILTGEIYPLVDRVHLRIKLLSTTGGDLLGSANADIPRGRAVAELLKRMDEKEAAPIPPMGNFTVWGKFATLAQTSQSLRVDLWTDRDTYKAGQDIIRFFVRANRDCYLTLVDFGTSGNVTVLFPNGFEGNNRIRAGEVYIIPDRYKSFTFPIQPPTGVEMVKAICTTQQVDLSLLGLPRQGFGSLRRERTRDIKVAQGFAESLSRMERAESSLIIRIQ